MEKKIEISVIEAVVIGSQLKHFREAAGLSIFDVAVRMKARRSLVDAIENAYIPQLPAPPHINHHWKTYAYLLGKTLPDIVDSVAVRTTDASDDFVLATQTECFPREKISCKAVSRESLFRLRFPKIVPTGVLLASIILIPLGLIAVAPDNRAREFIEYSPVPTVTSLSGQELIVTALSGSTEPMRSRDLTPDRIQVPPEQVELGRRSAEDGNRFILPVRTVFMVAKDDVWVQVRVRNTGQILLARTLRNGDQRTLSVDNNTSLTVGAPSNILISIDQKEISLQNFTIRGIVRDQLIHEMY